LLVAMKLPLLQNFLAIAVAAVLGGLAVALINQRLSASAHQIDAVAEAGGLAKVSTAKA